MTVPPLWTTGPPMRLDGGEQLLRWEYIGAYIDCDDAPVGFLVVEHLRRQCARMLLSPRERIPRIHGVAVEREREALTSGVRLAVQKAMKHHREVRPDLLLGRSEHAFCHPGGRASRQHPIELFPQNDGSVTHLVDGPRSRSDAVRADRRSSVQVSRASTSSRSQRRIAVRDESRSRDATVRRRHCESEAVFRPRPKCPSERGAYAVLVPYRIASSRRAAELPETVITDPQPGVGAVSEDLYRDGTRIRVDGVVHEVRDGAGKVVSDVAQG